MLNLNPIPSKDKTFRSFDYLVNTPLRDLALFAGIPNPDMSVIYVIDYISECIMGGN